MNNKTFFISIKMITELCDEQIHNRCVTVTHLVYKSNSNHTGATPVALTFDIYKQIS